MEQAMERKVSTKPASGSTRKKEPDQGGAAESAREQRFGGDRESGSDEAADVFGVGRD